MLRTFNVGELVEKNVVGFGNGSIVYTPKKWIGKKVLVILEEKTLDITGEAMKILKQHLSSVEGIFLFGSFARNEETEKSDVDLLVISDEKIGLKKKGKFDFLVKTRKELVNELKEDPTLFLHQAVKEAKPIFNASLLEELKEVKVMPDFKKFFDNTLSAFKKVNEILEDGKKEDNYFVGSGTVVYSLILRLRSLFLIQCFKKRQEFSNKKFSKMLKIHGFKEKTVNHLLDIYRAERDDKKTSQKIVLSDVEKLFETAKIEFLKTEEIVAK